MRSEQKSEFTHDVLRIVTDLCKLVFNLNPGQGVEHVFGTTHEQLENVIQKIVQSLPTNIFELPAKRLEEIKSIFAKEFIFFQVQEKLNDPNYENDLSNFIYAFSRDIQAKFATLVKEK